MDAIKAVMVLVSLIVATVGLALPGYGGLTPVTSLVLNLCAGGVILSSALCHLLPDAAETDGGFPWTFALCGCGYLATLSVSSFFSHSHGEAFEAASTYTSVLRMDGGESLEVESPGDARRRRRDRSAIAAATAATAALSAHALGDGAVIGVQVDPKACVVVGVAILVHKFFGALALGALLSRDGPLLRGHAAIFAAATPAALVATWAGAREDAFDGRFAARVTALCAGSLLHVCVHEILQDALARPHCSKAAKLAWVWAGFAAMTLLAVWV